MLIGDRLRAIREAKELSQGDIEERSGLLRSYISSVENDHTVPSVETLEKLARALEVPLSQLFYEGKRPPKLIHLREWKTADEIAWGRTTKEARLLEQFRRLLAWMNDSRRRLLLHVAQKMARR
jgi:transcriptional regulator with XRE-family HTH domain